MNAVERFVLCSVDPAREVYGMRADKDRLYGVAYGPGEVIPDVPEPVADQWIASGVAEEVNGRASKSARKSQEDLGINCRPSLTRVTVPPS